MRIPTLMAAAMLVATPAMAQVVVHTPNPVAADHAAAASGAARSDARQDDHAAQADVNAARANAAAGNYHAAARDQNAASSAAHAANVDNHVANRDMHAARRDDSLNVQVR